MEYVFLMVILLAVGALIEARTDVVAKATFLGTRIKHYIEDRKEK